MQNAHTRKTVYTFFLYFTTDLQKTEQNQRFFKTEPKTKPNQTRGFSKPNRTQPNVKNPFRTSLVYRSHVIQTPYIQSRLRNDLLRVELDTLGLTFNSCTDSQTCCDCVLVLLMQKSKPAIFHDPMLLMKMDSGQMLLWTRCTLLCRK